MPVIDKKCSRCKQDIQCNASNISACNCYQVTMAASTADYLRETKYNCLCNPCLLHLNDQVLKAEQSNVEMQEGIHYYIEEGNYVFTELYHIQRGYCCGSRCRHCAYGIHI